MTLTYQWIDLIWLPVAFYIVRREQRWWAIGLIASCMLMMRLEIELMEEIGYPHGLIGLMKSSVHNRLLVLYSLVYIAFFTLAHYSKNSTGTVFLAATISIFFMVLVLSVFVMVL